MELWYFSEVLGEVNSISTIAQQRLSILVNPANLFMLPARAPFFIPAGKGMCNFFRNCGYGSPILQRYFCYVLPEAASRHTKPEMPSIGQFRIEVCAAFLLPGFQKKSE